MVFLETREAVGMQPAGALRGHMLSFSISLEAAATAVGGASCHRTSCHPRGIATSTMEGRLPPLSSQSQPVSSDRI